MSPLFLKILAMLSMLLDHIGFALFPSQLAFRALGRLAMPIFCFLIAQGFFHTRSRPRYALRLLVFCLLSELPFDWMVGDPLSGASQNVFLTLLLGLLGIWGADALLDQKNVAKYLCFAPPLAAMAAAELLRGDYGWRGALAVTLLYAAEKYIRAHPRPDRRLVRGLAAAVAAVGLLWGSFGAGWRWFGLAAAPFLALYDEDAPRIHSPALRHALYWFYPVHILALCVLRDLFF